VDDLRRGHHRRLIQNSRKSHTDILYPFVREKNYPIVVGDVFGRIASVPADMMTITYFPDRPCIQPQRRFCVRELGGGKLGTFAWVSYRWDIDVSGIKREGCSEGKGEKRDNDEKESRERSHDHNEWLRVKPSEIRERLNESAICFRICSLPAFRRSFRLAHAREAYSNNVRHILNSVIILNM